MGNRTCSIEGCDAKHEALGMCARHYQRAHYGSPDPRYTRSTLPHKDRMLRAIDKPADPDACWLWKKSLRNGYGTFGLKGRPYYAHRVAYQEWVGPIPDGMDIDHMCHNRACINPLHLRAVTRKQNLENHSGPRPNNTSGARGVYLNKRTQKWLAYATHNGKRYHGGTFDNFPDAEAAAIALRNRLFTHNDIDRAS